MAKQQLHYDWSRMDQLLADDSAREDIGLSFLDIYTLFASISAESPDKIPGETFESIAKLNAAVKGILSLKRVPVMKKM